MKKLFSIGAMLFLFALTGCAALTPGNIQESQSTFDGSTELVMEPPALVRSSAATWSGTSMEMSLFWNSKMKPGRLVLEVYVEGIQSFAQAESLHFNINGEIMSFISIDQLTGLETESGFFGPLQPILQRDT
jgi:starvation-inducible outer membrane lipoprotein